MTVAIRAWLRGLSALAVIASVCLFFGQAHAATGISQTMSFEGKIVNASGVNIADGTYNMEFKIYTAATACTPTTGAGCTLGWTEDWLVSGGHGVALTSGTFAVNLDSVAANNFSGIDFNSNPLYLSIQIGNTSSCTISTTFQANCGGDGEMKPYLQLTSTPYALNSNAVGGLTASQLAQLAATQTFTGTNTFQQSTNATSVKVLQNSNASPTADVFDVQGANGTTNFIQVTSTAANQGAVTISSQGSSNALTLQGAGGVSLNTPAVSAATTNSTNVTIATGNSTTSGNTGTISIATGNATSGTSGNITIDNGTSTTGAPTISIGTANARSLSLGNSTAATAVSINSGSTGGLSLNSNGGTLNVSSGAGALNLGSSGSTGTVQIGNTTGAVTQNINVGNNGTASSTSNVTVGSTVAGSTTIQNASTINLNAGTVVGNATTQNLFNTVATTLNIGGAVGSGGIVLAGGSGSTGCTLDGSTGNFACTGNITGGSTGTQGYWTRSGTSLSPATAGDAVTTSGNISTSGSGTITSAGLLTGSAGLTASGGAISLTGNNTSSLTTSSGALTLTSAAAATWSTSAGALTVQGAAGLNLGTNAVAQTIAIGNNTTTTAVNLTSGSGGINLNGATTVGVIGSVNGQLTVASSHASGSFVFQASTSQANSTTIALPTDANASDTICLSTLSNCTAVGAASGDLTGSYPGPTIAKLQGGTLTITSVATGQVLNYNGSAWVNTSSPTLAGGLTVSGGGQDINLTGATSNYINFNTTGVAPPAFTTRSNGTKVVLYSQEGASSVDYALGIDNNTLWNSVPTTAQQFQWYAGTTQAALLSGTGNLSVAGTVQGTQLISTVATGTAPLSVTSSTVVANLNASYLQGYTPGNASGNIPISNGTLNTNLNSQYLNGLAENQLAQNLRAGYNLTGGGTETYDGTNVKWTNRLIVIADGYGTDFSTNGYFDIVMPTSGTITGVGGASNQTATASGIPLPSWTALYYILPIGSGNGTNNANFRLVSYTGSVQVPSGWVLLAIHNGDDNSVRFGTGQTLTSGFSSTAGVTTSYIQNSTSVQSSANFNISGNGTMGGLLTVQGTGTSSIAGSLQLASSATVLSQYDANGSLKITTPSGYVTIGSENTGWAHFYTDRSQFFFSQGITTNNGVFSSYTGNNLQLQVGGTTAETIASSNGAATFMNSANSTAAFQIQNSAGVALLNADTTNSRLEVTGLTAPTISSLVFVTNTGGSLSGSSSTTYYYKVSALNASGETLASNEVNIAASNFLPIGPPGAASAAPIAGSKLGIGTYLYEVTYTTANGETTGGTEFSVTTTSGNQSVSLTAIPTGPTGTTGRKIYRTAVGGATGTEKLVTTVGDNTTTTYTDSTPDASLGAALPGSNTARTNTNEVQLTWAAVTGATSYRIYRGTSAAGENAYQTGTSPFTDTGAAGTAGTPSANNTSQALAVGVATPTANLDVRGTAFFQPGQDSTTAFKIQDAGGTVILNVDSINDRVGIGTSSPQYALDVVGNIASSGEILADSANALCMENSTYNSLWRNDNSATYLLLNSGGNSNCGGWNTFRPFAVSDSTGRVSLGNQLEFSNTTSNTAFYGNVGYAGPGSCTGEKIQLYGTVGSCASNDYALGIASGTLWLNTGSVIDLDVAGTNYATVNTSGITLPWSNGVGFYLNNTGGGGFYDANASYGNATAIEGNNTTPAILLDGAGHVNVNMNVAGSSAVCFYAYNSYDAANGTGGYKNLTDCNGTPSADYAEMYPTVSGNTYGDIVAMGTNMVQTYGKDANGDTLWTDPIGEIAQTVKTTEPYQNNTIGIISDNNSDFASTGYNIEKADNPVPVALNGRVPVNVSSGSEPIQPGDWVTTSTDAGKAMKATQAGFVIGKALAAWDPASGQTQVMVFVQPEFWPGPSMSSYVQNGGNATLAGLTVSGTADFADLNASGATTLNDLTVTSAHVTGNLSVDGNLTVQGLATVVDLQVNGHIITGGGQPVPQAQTATGAGGTVTVSGTDTTGTIMVTTGSNPSAGDLANIVFSKGYGGTPRILLTGQDGTSAASFAYPSNKSTTGFELHMDGPPKANTTYNFDYFIAQ